MTRPFSRRHHRLHEQVLLSRSFTLLVGWLVAVMLPAWLLWGQALWQPDPGQLAAVVASTLAHVLAALAVHALARYPGARSAVYVAPQVLLTYALITLATLLLRLDMSRLLMGVTALTSMVWCHLEFVLRARFQRPKFAVVATGAARDVLALPGIDTRQLQAPALDGRRYDGVIADLGELPGPDWEKFLAHCALSRVPVYHAPRVLESLTGRVRIQHISENPMGSLLPSATYERLKYLMDLAIILVTLPLVVPVALVTALAIRLESPGPILFSQERVGQGNRPFRIYKFRSMVTSSEAGGARFASTNDSRVTRVGHVIRKLRIDELPQFINVIQGHMSLIGPRPEQHAFVEEFEDLIPFYTYRHVVKPGITGWAQVTQGYAADADDTRIKIEYDFYYIKHCSLALDLFIVLRTLQTMLTGFGAR